MAKTFQCTLMTPERSVLDEPVVYASLPAWDGLLGVVCQRAPLVVKLGIGSLRLDLADGSSRWFFVGGGFAQMKDNKLALLTDEVTTSDQVEAEEAKASLKEALARRAIDDTEVARKERELAKARSLIELAGR